MKKKTFSLDALKVDSFITNPRTVKGGVQEPKPTAPPSNSCYFSCFLECYPENEFE